MKLIIVIALILSWTSVADAKGCNIANILFGKVRIVILPHKEPNGAVSYETGIILGNDFPEVGTSKFDYMKMLGQISPPERDGSRAIFDVNGERCGTIETMDEQGRPLREMVIDTTDTDCDGCDKTPIILRRVPPNSYVVMRNDEIMGTISGRLNK